MLQITNTDSRISKAFVNKAKVAYLTAGDGLKSCDYFRALANAGVGILEVGIPFSDPIADGPVITDAMTRALKLGTNVTQVLATVREIRAKSEVAIIIFTYYNPLFGCEEEFLIKAQESGVDGVLVVDLPFEESESFYNLACKHGIALINVISPSTPLVRLEQIVKRSQGFLYYACQKGTTGTREHLPRDMVAKIGQIKECTSLPVAVGFGVSTNEMVLNILEHADGCVIGSYFVAAIKSGITPAQLEKLASEVFKC